MTISLTIGGAIFWLFISVHPLWLGLMLSYLFGFRLGVLPKAG